MKKSLLLPVTLLFSLPSAATEVDRVELSEQIKTKYQRISDISKQLGVSEKTYLYAEKQYLDSYSGEVPEGFKSIREYPAWTNPEAHAEIDVIRAYNTNKADFANYFGLPVDKLEAFLRDMPNAHELDAMLGDTPATADKVKSQNFNDTDMIIVSCTNGCGYPEPDLQTIAQIDQIMRDKQDIKVFDKLTVQFMDGAEQIGSQVWTYRAAFAPTKS